MALLPATVATLSHQSSANTAPKIVQEEKRRVGLAYSLWHVESNWMARGVRSEPWGTPELGYYVSSDRAIMQKHAAWLSDAGVDFVFLDWSNNLGTDTRNQNGPPDQLFIENTTPLLFDVWTKLTRRPQISFLIGIQGDVLRSAAKVHGAKMDLDVVTKGTLREKADQIYQQYVEHPVFGPLLERHQGKPLLIVMIGVPTPFRIRPPEWTDSRFTVRYMTAYLSEQPGLASADGVSSLGYWSWEDRGPPSYAVRDGRPEAMTVVAAWRAGSGLPGQGRKEGQTYRDGWARARRIGPQYVLAGTFNEWWRAEQIGPEQSKDVEPSREFGHTYLDIIKQESAAFKQKK